MTKRSGSATGRKRKPGTAAADRRAASQSTAERSGAKSRTRRRSTRKRLKGAIYGPCRYDDCPRFAGDGTHCTRCWHHWSTHDIV
jgi:hypothetical protein